MSLLAFVSIWGAIYLAAKERLECRDFGDLWSLAVNFAPLKDYLWSTSSSIVNSLWFLGTNSSGKKSGPSKYS